MTANFATALQHFQAGQLSDAEGHCRNMLRANARHADSLHLLGVIASRHGQFAAAAAHIRKAIAIDARVASYHNSLGNAFRELGRHAQAIRCYRTATDLMPDFAQAYANLGAALFAAGQVDEAIASYGHAVTLKPDFHEALNNFGNALRDLGRLDEAISCHRRVIAVRPDCAAAHNNLGNELQETGDLAGAIASHCKAIELDPAFAAAYYNLANALHARGQFDQAITVHRRAIELKPDYPEAHTNLGNALHEVGQIDAAVACHRRALELRPDYVEAHNNLGNALREQGALDQAIACHRAAIALNPDFAAAYSNLGSELEEQGRFVEARDAHERAITLAPRRGSFHHRLANMGCIGPDSPHLPRMAALADAEGIAETDRMEFHFALGLVQRGADPAGAFRHLLQANRIKRGQINYDEAATLAMFARIRTVFTKERLSAAASFGAPSDVPVFVVGMPRSGTTLVEQILASHPDIHGAGELADLPRLLGALEPRNPLPQFPEALDILPPYAAARLGAAYVECIRARAPSAARIVDKLPGNFMRVGFIHLALPGARIIHVRRDPVDTCLSCFSKLFGGYLPFAYDLAELGRYYNEYDTLMAHWRQTLPPGVMLEVRYEDIVADFAVQARRMIDHCGVAWDDKCLAFHENRRAVQTYSAAQVRRPLYAHAVGGWQLYADLAGPLLEALRGDACAEGRQELLF